MTIKAGTWQWDAESGRVTIDRHTAEIYCLQSEPQQFDKRDAKVCRSIHPDDREPTDELLTKSLKDAAPFAMVHRVATRSGLYSAVFLRGSTLTVGSTTRVFGVATVLMRDASELKISASATTLPTELLVAAASAARDLRRELLSFTIGTALMESCERDCDAALALSAASPSRH